MFENRVGLWIMNLTWKMIPGLTLTIMGALLCGFASRICAKNENALRVKMAGVLVSAAGAVLVFTT